MVQQQMFPGMVVQSQSWLITVYTYSCNECGGRGKVIKKVCPHCGGSKVVDHTAHYTLEVLPGMPEGYEVVFEGEGDESPDWEAGDIVIKVRSGKQKGSWRRKETSLYWSEIISVEEVAFLSSAGLRKEPNLLPRRYWALSAILRIWMATSLL
jgi:DnaJ-related protein SCJ1